MAPPWALTRASRRTGSHAAARHGSAAPAAAIASQRTRKLSQLVRRPCPCTYPVQTAVVLACRSTYVPQVRVRVACQHIIPPARQIVLKR